jgi:uncharacterized Zn finger protein
MMLQEVPEKMSKPAEVVENILAGALVRCISCGRVHPPREANDA